MSIYVNVNIHVYSTTKNILLYNWYSTIAYKYYNINILVQHMLYLHADAHLLEILRSWAYWDMQMF